MNAKYNSAWIECGIKSTWTINTETERERNVFYFSALFLSLSPTSPCNLSLSLFGLFHFLPFNNDDYSITFLCFSIPFKFK
jgi:hypothetical protein